MEKEQTNTKCTIYATILNKKFRTKEDGINFEREQGKHFI